MAPNDNATWNFKHRDGVITEDMKEWLEEMVAQRVENCKFAELFETRFQHEVEKGLLDVPTSLLCMIDDLIQEEHVIKEPPKPRARAWALSERSPPGSAEALLYEFSPDADHSELDRDELSRTAPVLLSLFDQNNSYWKLLSEEYVKLWEDSQKMATHIEDSDSKVADMERTQETIVSELKDVTALTKYLKAENVLRRQIAQGLFEAYKEAQIELIAQGARHQADVDKLYAAKAAAEARVNELAQFESQVIDRAEQVANELRQSTADNENLAEQIAPLINSLGTPALVASLEVAQECSQVDETTQKERTAHEKTWHQTLRRVVNEQTDLVSSVLNQKAYDKGWAFGGLQDAQSARVGFQSLKTLRDHELYAYTRDQVDTQVYIKARKIADGYIEKFLVENEIKVEDSHCQLLHLTMVATATSDPCPFFKHEASNMGQDKRMNGYRALADRVAKHVFGNELHFDEESPWYQCDLTNRSIEQRFNFHFHPCNITESSGYFAALKKHAWQINKSLRENTMSGTAKHETLGQGMYGCEQEHNVGERGWVHGISKRFLFSRVFGGFITSRVLKRITDSLIRL